METPTEAFESTVGDWRQCCGLFVVAFGEPARKCAQRCIQSFRHHNPGIPIALCAESSLGLEDILIQQRDTDIGARSPKVRIYDLAPAEWRYVLYLDADTETKGPLDSLFAWVADGWDLCICNNPGRFAVAENMGRADNTNECKETFELWGSDQMMQLGGGVFGFRRSPGTARFFRRWGDEWQQYGKRDQGALLRAIWHEPLRVLMLMPGVWNCVAHGDENKPGQYRYPYDQPDRAAIIHYPITARRWSGIIQGRNDSPEAWARVHEWEKAKGQAVAR